MDGRSGGRGAQQQDDRLRWDWYESEATRRRRWRDVVWGFGVLRSFDYRGWRGGPLGGGRSGSQGWARWQIARLAVGMHSGKSRVAEKASTMDTTMYVTSVTTLAHILHSRYHSTAAVLLAFNWHVLIAHRIAAKSVAAGVWKLGCPFHEALGLCMNPPAREQRKRLVVISSRGLVAWLQVMADGRSKVGWKIQLESRVG